MNWNQAFDERQDRLIRACVNYASNEPAGLPGHNLMIIIATMSIMLDEQECELNELEHESNK